MTTTSVKGLNSLMTFISPSGTTKSGETAQDFGFGDMMAKAGERQTNDGSTDAITPGTKPNGMKSDNKKISEADAKPNADKTDSKEINTKEKTEEPASKTEVKETDIPDEVKENVQTAVLRIIEVVTEELEISEEELVNALETLGLSATDLLDSTNLSNLVLEVKGESDPMALVTDEALFTNVKNLTTAADAAVADLAKDMDMAIDDVKAFFEELEGELKTTGEPLKEAVGINMSVEADSDTNTIKEYTPKIKVTASQNGKTVEFTTDEKSNVLEAKTVDDGNKVNESKNNSGERDTSKNEDTEKNENGLLTQKTGIHQQSVTNNAPAFENLVNDTNEAAAAANRPFISEETQRIMDQIMDRIRVNVRQDVEQLEMHLHPASLGNVKINLISKAGEVTAEFKVQNESVKAAVESQLADLKESFRASGTKVTAIEVSVETRSFDSNLWQNQRQDSRDYSENNKRRQRRINLNEIDALLDEETSEEDALAVRMMEATGGTVDFTA